VVVVYFQEDHDLDCSENEAYSEQGGDSLVSVSVSALGFWHLVAAGDLEIVDEAGLFLEIWRSRDGVFPSDSGPDFVH